MAEEERDAKATREEASLRIDGVERSVEVEENDSVGEIKIAEDVVLTIAGLAIGEVKGITVVNSVTDGLKEKFSKKNYSRGLRVVLSEDDVVTIDIHIIVDYGLRIPDVAWELQEAVKKAIEGMTNLTCDKINIFVDGVNLDREEKERDEKE